MTQRVKNSTPYSLGEGLFDGVYLDDRLRVGQNLNGGGARIVQVRDPEKREFSLCRAISRPRMKGLDGLQSP